MKALLESSLDRLLLIHSYLSDHISRNEELDEVKTTDMPYIATDYYIALKYLSLNRNREAVLAEAKRHLILFFDWLNSFNILSRPAPSLDPLQSRQEKIYRFQEIKRLEAMLSAPADMIKDEEELRNYWMNWLNLKGLEAMNESVLIDAELKLLSNHAVQESTFEAKSDNHKVSVTQPFVLTRETLRNSVFRPGHTMPSMSIDEFLLLEKQRGNIINKSEKDTGPKGDCEKDSEFDAETFKLRQRDERWDWIRKGSGNTFNRS